MGLAGQEVLCLGGIFVKSALPASQALLSVWVMSRLQAPSAFSSQAGHWHHGTQFTGCTHGGARCPPETCT